MPTVPAPSPDRSLGGTELLPPSAALDIATVLLTDYEDDPQGFSETAGSLASEAGAFFAASTALMSIAGWLAAGWMNQQIDNLGNFVRDTNDDFSRSWERIYGDGEQDPFRTPCVFCIDE